MHFRHNIANINCKNNCKIIPLKIMKVTPTKSQQNHFVEDHHTVVFLTNQVNQSFNELCIKTVTCNF